MKRVLLITISAVASLVAGALLTPLAFAFAWGLGDYSAGNSPSFTGGWIVLLFTMAVAFVTGFYAGRPCGQFWWIHGGLLVLPAALFLGPTVMQNFQMGHVPGGLLLPLVAVALPGFVGGGFGCPAASEVGQGVASGLVSAETYRQALL